MPPVKVDPAKVKTFKSATAFHAWLSVNHHKEDEVCWIDAVRKRFDDKRYLQRYASAQGHASEAT